MRCSKCRTQLNRFELGELGAEEKQRIADHLASCPACRQELAHLERLRGLLPPVAAIAPQRDLWPAVVARIGNGRRQPAQPRRRWVWGTAAAIAGAVVAVALTVVLVARPPLPILENGWSTEADIAALDTEAVWDDPWAGEVTQALDWALTEEALKAT